MSKDSRPPSRQSRATARPDAAARDLVTGEVATQSYCVLRRTKGEIKLRVGTMMLGRATDCDITLGDGAASRHHATLTVGSDSAVVEDLNSANGTWVNGGRLTAKRALKHGDVLRIGGEDLMFLSIKDEARVRDVSTAIRPAIDELVQTAEFDEPTGPMPADTDIEALVDGVLARGQGDEAERLLGHRMGQWLKQARAGDLTSDDRERAATFAARLAAATTRGKWLDYALELYGLAGVPPTSTVMDLLEAAASLVDGYDAEAVATHARHLTSMVDRFDAGERMVIRRLEELAQSASWG